MSDTIDAAPAEATEAQPADAAAEQAAPRKLPMPVELKFKGKVEKVDDLDQLARWAQMGRGATEVFESAKKLREEAEAKASRLEKLRGGSFDERLSLLTEALGDEEAALQFMEEAIFQKRIAPQQLTPEQRQLQEMQRKLQQYEAEKANTTKAQQQAELERQADIIANQYAKTAADIMQKLGWGAELAPVVLREMLPYAEQALEAGMEPVSEDIMGMFLSDQQAKLGHLTAKLEGEALLRFLGDDLANKVRKADLARLRKGSAPPQQQQTTQRQKPRTQADKEADRLKRKRDFWDIPVYK